MLVIDSMIFERLLYSNGSRGVFLDPKGDKPRSPNSNLSLEHLLYTFTIPLSPNLAPTGSDPIPPKQMPIVLPNCTLHNAGNDALMCLFAFQKLLDPTTQAAPTVKKAFSAAKASPMPLQMPLPVPFFVPPSATFPTRLSVGNMQQRPASAYDLSLEFGQISMKSAEHKINSYEGRSHLMVPGRPGEKAKRFNSFPGTAAQGGWACHSSLHLAWFQCYISFGWTWISLCFGHFFIVWTDETNSCSVIILSK